MKYGNVYVPFINELNLQKKHRSFDTLKNGFTLLHKKVLKVLCIYINKNIFNTT